MARSRAVRLAAAEEKAQEMRATLDEMVLDLPRGEARNAAQMAASYLRHLEDEARREKEQERIQVKEAPARAREKAIVQAVEQESRSLAVAASRSEGGLLLHELREDDDPRMADVWFHGTVGTFGELRAQAPESHTRGFNPRLGIHFAAEHGMAEGFAAGLYRNKPGQHQTGRVYAVRLHSSRPKVFASERAFHADFFEFCWQRGRLTGDDLESVRSYRRLPKGSPDGLSWWDKVAVGAGIDLAQGIKNLDQVVGEYREKVAAEGYDAVVYLNDIEGRASPCAIVFADSQIEQVGVLRKNQVYAALPATYVPGAYERELATAVLGT